MLHRSIYNSIYKDFNNITVSDPHCKTGIEVVYFKHLAFNKEIRDISLIFHDTRYY